MMIWEVRLERKTIQRKADVEPSDTDGEVVPPSALGRTDARSPGFLDRLEAVEDVKAR